MCVAVTYGITEEVYSLGADARTAYGIAAYAHAEADGTATVLYAIHDITSDREALQALVDACNGLKLSGEHLYDIVEDFLTD